MKDRNRNLIGEMANRVPYELVFDQEVFEHLSFVDRKYHSQIQAVLEEQLLHDPGTETKNRKPLRAEIMEAGWELRLGPKNRFRVLYNIDEAAHAVRILAVGVKERNRLFVGGKEVGP